MIEKDPDLADRDPVVVARWVGADRAEVTLPTGGHLYSSEVTKSPAL
ncbi:MAG: hypothetical protein ACRDJ5_02295 [Actinomycetota bacterium]